MSAFQARAATQKQLRYVPHTSVSGETWQFIKTGIATSNGSAGGTTLVDVGGDSGVADTYNGQYYIEMRSGANQWDSRRIIDDDGAGTLTVENNGFDNQIASGDAYAIWKSPEPVFTVTTPSSTTQFTCSARTEANDFWIGYECMLIANAAGSGPARGEIQTISDSTSGGLITVDSAFTNAPQAGDVLLIGKFVEIGSESFSLSHDYIPRPGNRVNFGMGDGLTGPRGGTFGFNTQIRPSGTLAADGVVANKSEISGLFQAVGLVENQDTSHDIVNDDSTTTVLEVAAASWEDFTIGNMVVVNGTPTFITALSDGTGTASADQITVSPALPIAPTNTAGDVVAATCGYHKSTDSDVYGVCIEMERDGVRETMTGCKGSVQLVDGAAPELQWSFNVDHYVREIEAAPYANLTAYSTAPAVQSKDRVVYRAIGTPTKADVMGFTATPGTVVVARGVQGSAGINGRSGFQLTNFAARMTWTELLDAGSNTLPRENAWLARTARDIAVLLGSHGNTFSCRMPVARYVESPHPNESDSLLASTVVWEGQDAGQYNGTSPVTNSKVPDFSFHLS